VLLLGENSVVGVQAILFQVFLSLIGSDLDVELEDELWMLKGKGPMSSREGFRWILRWETWFWISSKDIKGRLDFKRYSWIWGKGLNVVDFALSQALAPIGVVLTLHVAFNIGFAEWVRNAGMN
jgi:hypothetical protein